MSEDDAKVDRLAAKLDENPNLLLAFVGPTASGKTELAIRVCEKVGGEIVSVDSVQVYRGFDIGSGKPNAEERLRARHHLIDVVGPLEPIDASRFAELAALAITDIRARGKKPILCGGTFLWLKALLFGLAEAAPASEEIRARHRSEIEAIGREAFHDRLRAVDPESAERLHFNDVVRVSRALEVHELTGKKLSDEHRAHRFANARYEAELFAVARTPEDLTNRIRLRVESWLSSGWIEETEKLLADGYGPSRAMTTVGYREVRDFLVGDLARADLSATIVRRTRVFARRQRTWLNQPGAPFSWV
ncbi:MAG: tRNA (adenosine(37)-N6)-dimethylallyltransferase MiaA [Polyangiaceae bacterium]